MCLLKEVHSYFCFLLLLATALTVTCIVTNCRRSMASFSTHVPIKVDAVQNGVSCLRVANSGLVPEQWILSSEKPWGSRMVVPSSLKASMLKELHDTHPGVSCTKSLGRMFVWWPGFDKQVKEFVRGCDECQHSHSACPFCSPVASMSMALIALVKTTLWFCRSFSGSSLPGSHWCLF